MHPGLPLHVAGSLPAAALRFVPLTSLAKGIIAAQDTGPALAAALGLVPLEVVVVVVVVVTAAQAEGLYMNTLTAAPAAAPALASWTWSVKSLRSPAPNTSRKPTMCAPRLTFLGNAHAARLPHVVRLGLDVIGLRWLCTGRW
eukprot:COSAG02_NODE_290_length_25531_cov_75.132392_17_plen_143_part_00